MHAKLLPIPFPSFCTCIFPNPSTSPFALALFLQLPVPWLLLIHRILIHFILLNNSLPRRPPCLLHHARRTRSKKKPSRRNRNQRPRSLRFLPKLPSVEKTTRFLTPRPFLSVIRMSIVQCYQLSVIFSPSFVAVCLMYCTVQYAQI